MVYCTYLPIPTLSFFSWRYVPLVPPSRLRQTSSGPEGRCLPLAWASLVRTGKASSETLFLTKDEFNESHKCEGKGSMANSMRCDQTPTRQGVLTASNAEEKVPRPRGVWRSQSVRPQVPLPTQAARLRWSGASSPLLIRLPFTWSKGDGRIW